MGAPRFALQTNKSKAAESDAVNIMFNVNTRVEF